MSEEKEVTSGNGKATSLLISDVTLPNKGSYQIDLFRREDELPTVSVSVFDSESYTHGGFLSLSSAEARKIAAELIAAADKLDEGWR